MAPAVPVAFIGEVRVSVKVDDAYLLVGMGLGKGRLQWDGDRVVSAYEEAELTLADKVISPLLHLGKVFSPIQMGQDISLVSQPQSSKQRSFFNHPLLTELF
jgi:hypothetical protein